MEAIPDVYCVTVDSNDAREGEKKHVFRHCFNKISLNSCFFSFLNKIAFEGIKGVSGFVALDDIKYTPGVNCDNQLVDPKPGEMHCFNTLLKGGLIHTDSGFWVFLVLKKFRDRCLPIVKRLI